MQEMLIGAVLRAALDQAGAEHLLIMWRMQFVAGVALLVLMLIGAANAQQTSIAGSVTDRTGSAIARKDAPAQTNSGAASFTIA
jgi:hypothetical protein